MSVDLAHIRQVMAEADCLFNNDEVEAAIGRVAGRSTAISARPTRWSSA